MPCLFGACGVNFPGSFSGVGENNNLVVTYFYETASKGDIGLLSRTAEYQCTRLKLGHQRRVLRQDGHFTLTAGQCNRVNVLFGEDNALGRNDLQVERHYLALLRKLFGLFDGTFDRANHVEGLLGQGVMGSFEDFLSASDCFPNRDILPGRAGEDLRHEHWLG